MNVVNFNLLNCGFWKEWRHNISYLKKIGHDSTDEDEELDGLEKSFYLCPLKEKVPQPGRSKLNFKGERKLTRDVRTSTGCLDGVETILKWLDKKDVEIGNH
jgi:hypothetical protein